MNWSNLKLPWVDLDWLIDISCQITELDLSANCLVSLPSVIPWGLMNLRKLSLADNQLAELPSVQSSDEIICTRCVLDAANRALTESRCKVVAGVKTAATKSIYRSFLVAFLPVVKLNFRFALLHSQHYPDSCQDSCREFQTSFLIVSRCFCSSPVLVSTIPLRGESQP